jgi:Rrf2 family protein
MISIARKKQFPVSSETIAELEGVSKKYLDGILGRLRGAALIKSFRGQGGGYVLARAPEEIRLSEIICVLEEGTAIVPCVEDPSACEKVRACPSREVWCTVSTAIDDTLKGITLADLTDRSAG